MAAHAASILAWLALGYYVISSGALWGLPLVVAGVAIHVFFVVGAGRRNPLAAAGTPSLGEESTGPADPLWLVAIGIAVFLGAVGLYVFLATEAPAGRLVGQALVILPALGVGILRRIKQRGLNITALSRSLRR